MVLCPRRRTGHAPGRPSQAWLPTVALSASSETPMERTQLVREPDRTEADRSRWTSSQVREDVKLSRACPRPRCWRRLDQPRFSGWQLESLFSSFMKQAGRSIGPVRLQEEKRLCSKEVDLPLTFLSGSAVLFRASLLRRAEHGTWRIPPGLHRGHHPC